MFSQVAAVDETLRWRVPFLFMKPDLATPLPPLAFWFHGAPEEVPPQAPDCDQGAESVEQFAVFEPFVTEKLTHVGVVFLLYVSLFGLCSGACPAAPCWRACAPLR